MMIQAPKSSRMHAVSLFSGIGLLDLGLHRAGPTAALGDVLRDDAIRLLELRPRLAQDIRDALVAESAGA